MNWMREVGQARDVGSVLEVVNEYLGAMADFTRSALAMPEQVTEPKEVFGLHRRLADAASLTPGDEQLQEVAVFIVRAAARLAELNGNGNGRHERISNEGDFRRNGGNGRH